MHEQAMRTGMKFRSTSHTTISDEESDVDSLDDHLPPVGGGIPEDQPGAGMGRPDDAPVLATIEGGGAGYPAAGASRDTFPDVQVVIPHKVVHFDDGLYVREGSSREDDDAASVGSWEAAAYEMDILPQTPFKWFATPMRKKRNSSSMDL